MRGRLRLLPLAALAILNLQGVTSTLGHGPEIIMVRAISLYVLTFLVGLAAVPAVSLGQDSPNSDAKREAMRRAMEARGRARGGAPPQPGEPPKPDGEKKEEGDKPKEGEEKKEGEEADSIKRPEKPPRVPDPREFDVKPDKDGMVEFNFYGQGWPDVLQWFANISDYSLDWQELPKGYVNVTTTRRYSLGETRDLFNRMLLERGYTMLQQGRILTVTRISKVDPSLLLRVEDESQLLDLPAHDFVKITFQLPDELKADQAAADVKNLLSTHAKVHPLLATNRLLIIDAVINLREVSQLVNAEHAAATGHTVPSEFPVRFARADRVADQVMILLGLDPSSRRTPQELQVEQQRLQLFQQMQQRGRDVSKFLRPGSAPTVFLAVNERNNSILANAPPAEMKTIERAILFLDVPSGSIAGGATPGGLGQSRGTFGDPLTMQKHQLVSISPQSIISALEEIGDLDPRTRVRADSDADVIFANATPRDHEKIKSMIDSLDGTGRQLKVVWLRRLPALKVAETLHKLMVGEKEEKSNSRRSYYDYYSYRYGRGEEKKDKGEFRIDADIERNRLLLWCTDAELAEVEKFLRELGEIPGESGNPHTVRFLTPAEQEDTARILETLRRAWQGKNELKIQLPDPEEEEPEEDEQKSPVVVPNAKTTSISAADLFVSTSVNAADPPRDVDAQASDAEEPAQEETAAAPDPEPQQPSTPEAESQRAEQDLDSESQDKAEPISITVTADGRIMLHSRDTVALDRLEDLLSSLTPPAPNYKVYYLKFALASLVRLNLVEYFEEDPDFNTDENWMRAWYGMDFEADESAGTGLSAQRKIRFIYDVDTNSILVSNASPSQLATVDALIEIYDRPPETESYSARRFMTFELQYAKAEPVAQTIKEVFRDLLSSKDKDFEKQQQGEKQGSRSSGAVYRIYGSGLSSSDDDKKPTTVKASFEGALSLGVDSVSNTIIVSAQEEWMPAIGEMIKFLDEKAKPDTDVAVHQIRGTVNPAALQAALADILGEAWLGSQPPESKKQEKKQQAQPSEPMPRQQPQPGRNNNPQAATATPNEQ